MSSTRLIDNHDLFEQHDFELENSTVPITQMQELIADTISDIREVIDGLTNTQDCTDLMELIDGSIESLNDLIGKLEGER